MAPPAKKMSNGTRPYDRDSKSKKTETESVQRELAKLKEKSKVCPKTVAEESEDSSSDEEFFDPKELGDAEEGSEVESGEDVEEEEDGEEEEDDGESDEADEEGNDGKAKGGDKVVDEDSSDDE
jgi:hypothetical protein